MTVEQWLGLVRHLLTFAGGWMVSMGYFDEGTMQELIGAAITVIGAVWSYASKAPLSYR
jgi:hypothetical protein